MATLTALIVGLVVIATGLAACLHRRSGSRTETVEGLRAEQEHRARLQAARSSYSSIAMHNTHGLTVDDLERYRK
ncbi:hypothetical protein ACIRD3_13935 [Kitasatospora sp. NPDC093550]|uniref:hypothetical protein n=1 Tax=Kitasatospora sp. NPDC093550 TaxID=3364089 RepID=UPI00382792D4